MPDLVRPSGDGLGVYYLHQIQNHLNDWLIADRGIDHGVVDGTVGPFDVEVFLDEIRAFPINRIHELLRFTRALAARKQTTELVFSRTIKKHAQRVRPGAKKMLRSPSDNDGISGLRGVLNNPFGNFQNAFAVHYVQFVRI